MHHRTPTDTIVPPPLCLDRHGTGERIAEPTLRRGRAAAAEGAILCAFCLLTVTSEAERITVQGRHRHQCTNPAGITFRIGCFQRAPGCRTIGQPASEHTWFPGHAWQVAICADCRTHLGWRFATPGRSSVFFGLILAHLVASGPLPAGGAP